VAVVQRLRHVDRCPRQRVCAGILFPHYGTERRGASERQPREGLTRAPCRLAQLACACLARHLVDHDPAVALDAQRVWRQRACCLQAENEALKLSVGRCDARGHETGSLPPNDSILGKHSCRASGATGSEGAVEAKLEH